MNSAETDPGAVDGACRSPPGTTGLPIPLGRGQRLTGQIGTSLSARPPATQGALPASHAQCVAAVLRLQPTSVRLSDLVVSGRTVDSWPRALNRRPVAGQVQAGSLSPSNQRGWLPCSGHAGQEVSRNVSWSHCCTSSATSTALPPKPARATAVRRVTRSACSWVQPMVDTRSAATSRTTSSTGLLADGATDSRCHRAERHRHRHIKDQRQAVRPRAVGYRLGRAVGRPTHHGTSRSRPASVLALPPRPQCNQRGDCGLRRHSSGCSLALRRVVISLCPHGLIAASEPSDHGCGPAGIRRPLRPDFDT